MTLPCLKQSARGVEVSLLVQPRSSRERLVGLHDDALKIMLTAPPVAGAANRACRALLAKSFRVPKSRVVLLAGESSRHKRLLLEGLELNQVDTALKAFLQA